MSHTFFAECPHPGHTVDSAGRVVCPDPECFVAAVDAASDPMRRLPAERPEWILSSPARLDAAEVEALAVLGDAGLIEQIVAPGEDDEDLGGLSLSSAQRARLRLVG